MLIAVLMVFILCRKGKIFMRCIAIECPYDIIEPCENCEFYEEDEEEE